MMIFSRAKKRNLCKRRFFEVESHKALFIRKTTLQVVPYVIIKESVEAKEWQVLFDKRLACSFLKEAIFHSWPIEVHGVFIDLVLKDPAILGLDFLEPLNFSIDSGKYKKIGPRYFKGYKAGEAHLIVIVTPGAQSVYYHAHLIATYLDYIAKSSEALFAFNYPDLEDNLISVTSLDASVVSKKDIVLIGFALELQKMVVGSLACSLLSEKEGLHYTSRRYHLKSGYTLNFIEVHYDFISDNGKKLAAQFVHLGAQHVIYCGRLRTYEDVSNYYTRIFSPERYIKLEGSDPVRYITELENPFASAFPETATKWHLSQDRLSAPEALDEVCCSGDVESFDHDLAGIAAAIEDANHLFGRSTSFSPVHFAVDSFDSRCHKSRPYPLIDRDKQHYALRLIGSYLSRYFSSL